MSMPTGLSKELVFLILQFLDEEKYKQTVHRLESESGVFCSMDYIEELVTKGDWEMLETYLAGFISVNDSPYSVKMLFGIRKQKYIEALERNERAKALEILKVDLKPFRTINWEIYKEMTYLLTTTDIRENASFNKYSDNKRERAILVDELKKLYESNPDLNDKRQLPTIKHSRLRLLVNQSLNWQHQLCKNPRPKPDITTLLEDHVCVPPQAAQAPAPVANNQLTSSMLRAGFSHLRAFQPPEPPVFLATSRGQGAINPPALTPIPSSGVLVRAPHNTRSDSELVLRRSSHFGVSEIQNLPTSSAARPARKHIYNFLPTDDLPKNVISVINEGTEVKTMDFHPEYETLLSVGTNTGDVSLWEISNQMRIAHKKFSVWNIGAYSMPLQALMTNDSPVLVNRVMWSPNGLFLGVAYSKHIIHIYSYRAGLELQKHLEIEAHAGYVSDLAFTIRNHKLIIITCGEDQTIKVWDVETGANLYIFEGHNAPVSSICPCNKDNIQFIFSTAINGKIKAWFYDEPVSKIDYETPGYIWTKMAYSTDGSRFFSCGSSEDRESFLVEWIENQGTVKRTYLGLGKIHSGVAQFDTASRYLAAGNEFSIKFWDMDNKFLLYSTSAEGGLPVTPCIRFSKDGTLLAASTSDNCVKILGNQEGLRLVKSFENHSEAFRLASANAAKASTVTVGANASTSSAGTNIGFPDKSIPFLVMQVGNQDKQNMSDVRGRNKDGIEIPITCSRPKEITEPSRLRSLRLPDSLLSVKVLRLLYTHFGGGILALTHNGVHKLWRWQKNAQTQRANATADMAPEFWQPNSGIVMTNDIRDANLEDTVACLALSKNNAYALSSSGGKASLFNLSNFETLTTFLPPPPTVTCLIYHPKDNNMIILGMSDSSILIYGARFDKVAHTLTGHNKCVTGLAYVIDRNILISIGADNQLCMWDTKSWEKRTSQFLKLPSRKTNNPQSQTRVYLNPAQTHFMVVHEAQIAVYSTLRPDSCVQWVPRPASGSIADAVYSCDGESIFVCVEDGSVTILSANHLKLKCSINYAAYMPSKRSSIRVSPTAIAAHPSDPNQLALGLSNGAVYVLEPLESDKQWGDETSAETSVGPSYTNPDPDQA